MADNDSTELVKAAQLARELQGVFYKQERTDERLVEIVKEALAIEARVRALEGYAQSRAITEAREDERDKALHDRLGRMEKKINSVTDLGTKALGVIGSAIILACIAYVLKRLGIA